ncbi:unnamed protein product [Lactuca virosa]|uniref:BED-type domain-containing protein n=1 Tax=Lactuca virosa TaxID=75947 RepID=A0AAU9P8W5_9ASTR|nr:unnamed protein product [Lactuca virosa]
MEGSQKIVDEVESRSKQINLDPPTVNVEEDEEVGENKYGGQKGSWVWKHFYKKKIDKTVNKLRCPYSLKLMCARTKKSGTSSMRSHLKLYCVNFLVYDPKGKSGDSKKQSLLSFKKSGESGANSLEVHSFSQDKCRKSL